MSKFILYLIGALFLAGGLAYTAYKFGVSMFWISIGVIVIIGFRIMVAILKVWQ
jgi:hypothetical protein